MSDLDAAEAKLAEFEADARASVRLYADLYYAAQAKLARIKSWAEENRDDLSHEGADTRELLEILAEGEEES